MITNGKEYLRLPGVGRRRVGFLAILTPRSTLWLGANHVLSVDSWGYSEDYRRFSYGDIQAIAVRPTRTFLVWSVVWTVVTLAFVALGLTNSEYWQIAWFSIAGLSALLLLRELLLGPTCRVSLKTAVQIEELPSLGRLRAFRRAMERLSPMIAGAQQAMQEPGPALEPPVESP